MLPLSPHEQELRLQCIELNDCAEYQEIANYNVSSARHQLKGEVTGILQWFIPFLIIGLYLLLSPILKRVRIRSFDLRAILGAALIVIVGFIVAGLAGLLTIGFRMCFSSDCSGLTGAATGLIPASLSLLLTIPMAKQLLRQNSLADKNQQKSQKWFIVIGLIIIVWSCVAYIPKLSHEYKSYQSVKDAYALPGVELE